MKKLLIIGAGTAGTMMANKLRRALRKKEWDITIIDKNKEHYYQPGFLFVPFSIYNKQDVVKPKDKFFPPDINVVYSNVDKIVPEENKVLLNDGSSYGYDYLVIATGTRTAPEETPGLKEELWYKDIFDFYTLEGAVALQRFFKTWKGGNLVISIAEMPFKCPVAPLEFLFLADAYFTKKGIRNKVRITFTTPLSGAFTKPIATKIFSGLMKEKNIEIIPDFYIERVDNTTKKLISYDGQEIPFDVLTIVPVNMGDELIERSKMGDDLNFIPTDKHTLKAKNHNNIFVLGDAADIPTSKAGSVAHFAGEVLYKNIIAAIEGKELCNKFDGHSNCFVETGFGKATLIDFNYDVEPLPGTYPLPWLGPMQLLKNTRTNHFGKMAFKWIYWNMLLKGKELPVSNHMSMKGKKQGIVNK